MYGVALLCQKGNGIVDVMKQRKTHHACVQTAYGRHLAVFEPDERSGYIVTVPGLPGVITWGKNLAHGTAMAREAIELCVECLAAEARRTAKDGQRHAPRRPVRV